MRNVHAIGLGDPQPVGKQALFQPAVEKDRGLDPDGLISVPVLAEVENTPERVRTTLELTHQAMSIIQEIQCSHRLNTGRVLPLWRLVSQAIEYYGKENNHPFNLHPEPALHVPDDKRKV